MRAGVVEAIHHHIDQALTTYHKEHKYPASSRHIGENIEVTNPKHLGTDATNLLRYHLYHSTNFQVPNYYTEEEEYTHTTRISMEMYIKPDSTVKVIIDGNYTDMEVQMDIRMGHWLWTWSDWYSPRINLAKPITADTKWTAEDALKLRIPSNHERSSLTFDLTRSDSIDELMKVIMSLVYHQRNHGSLISIQATRISNMLLTAKQRGLPLHTRLLDVESLAPFIWYKRVDGLIWTASTEPPEYYDTE